MPRDAQPVRVLMILESGFPVRGGGGAESQVRTLALELIRRQDLNNTLAAAGRLTVLDQRAVMHLRVRARREDARERGERRA